MDAAELTQSGQAEWEQAALGDPLDRARVARYEGARRLIAEAKARSPRATVALQLLPSAPDAQAEIGSLCGLLGAASDAERSALLAAVAGVLARGPLDAEQPDVAGLRACASQLGQLKPKASGRDADFIASALQQLAERKVQLD